MAEETVDRCIETANLKPTNGCVTKGLILNGGEKWTPTSYIRLVQDYGLDTEVNPINASSHLFVFLLID